jgi:penicillin-binding protein 2
MVTMAAALDSGALTTATLIRDDLIFTKAGRPHVRCWAGGSHGTLNIIQALSVSCNYFFCEAAYRMGAGGDKYKAIETLNRYMVFFGLNDKTGVEIGEYKNTFDPYGLEYTISSPAFKEFLIKQDDEFAPFSEWDWYDGDTVRTAIGQSYNDVTPANMAKYITQIANRGTRYPLHLVNLIQDGDGRMVMRYEAVPEYTGMELADSTWDAIIGGMKMVVTRGTASGYFRGFEYSVAGKTGTAQQVAERPAHSSFGGFAPADDPQIAVYVNIPFGVTNALSGAAPRAAREILQLFLSHETEIEYQEPVNSVRK